AGEAARRGIALALDAPDEATAQGQPDALAVLLRNLVDNALRYTPEGGQVRVSVQSAGSGTGAALLVEDSGPGIAPEDRQRVLDRFYRAPGAAGHGSGLGLAIVNAIARQHEAALQLDASPALGGLRVALRWPD
ncbi:MAG: two-component sensor histidine kinase, partial [Ottowia sp.]|nr:two-component sensor histidine kinase [Ottowia sp.]